LREKAGLDVAGDVHFMSGAAFGFHALGDVLRKTKVFEGDGGLPSDRIEKAFVFTGIRLFGKRLTENEEANKVSAVTDHGDEAFGRKMGESEFVRRIDGTGWWNVKGTAASGEFDKEGRIRGKRSEFRRDRTAGGNEGVVVSAEVEGQRLGMEGLGEMVIEKGGELVAVSDRAGLVGEILEDKARIVGGAKEGTIDALRAAFDDRTRGPNEGDTKEGAESHTKLRVTYEKTRKETSEEEDGKKGAEEKKDVVAALNEDVTGTAAEESGDFEDAVFDDGVGEGKRIEKEHQKRERIVEPGGWLDAKQISRDLFENDGNDADQGSPEHDAGFTASVDGGGFAERIRKERSYGEEEKRIGNCEANITGSAVAEESGKRVWPVGIARCEAWKGLTETEEKSKPF
jgi:hypothetical protein